jgi:chromosome segregation ATPase
MPVEKLAAEARSTLRSCLHKRREFDATLARAHDVLNAARLAAEEAERAIATFEDRTTEAWARWVDGKGPRPVDTDQRRAELRAKANRAAKQLKGAEAALNSATEHRNHAVVALNAAIAAARDALIDAAITRLGDRLRIAVRDGVLAHHALEGIRQYAAGRKDGAELARRASAALMGWPENEPGGADRVMREKAQLTVEARQIQHHYRDLGNQLMENPDVEAP